MTEFVDVQIPMSMFSDAEILGLYSAAMQWRTKLEALPFLVANMCQHEAARRDHNRTHPESIEDAGHGHIRPSDWSDIDIADAIIFCWGFSEYTQEPKIGELVDELGRVFVTIAADRLRASVDPRNAMSFEERAILREMNESPDEESDDGTSNLPEV